MVATKHHTELGAALLSAAMALPCVISTAHAESAPEKGTLSFKYLNYKESQQTSSDALGVYGRADSKSGASAYDDRILVKATSMLVSPEGRVLFVHSGFRAEETLQLEARISAALAGGN